MNSVRIGVVSDVHGNAPGLSAALDRMGDVDDLWCVGDIVEEFRFSNEAVSLLRDRDAKCVLGNHDIGFLGPHGERARRAEHIDHELVTWLASHPLSIETTVVGRRMIMTHASPCPPHTQYVLPGSPEVKRIGETGADIVIIGHTHRQMAERVGRTLVLNPGSVGQARDPHNGRRLSYAVLTVTADDIDVTFDDYLIEPDHESTAVLAATGGTA